MTALMTKTELLTLFPAGGTAETEQARGRFLSALRLAEALTPTALLARLAGWREHRRTTAALAALPDAVLRDIGLTRAGIGQAAADAVQRRPIRR